MLINKGEEMFELWFRRAFQPFFENQTITAALRPGIRIFPEKKGTKVGETVKIRIISVPGNEEKNVPAILDYFEAFVKIELLIVKKIGDLTEKDFAGMSPDCQSIELAKIHLGLIYNRVFSERDTITIIRWKYIQQ